jgi:hypothetical protein
MVHRVANRIAYVSAAWPLDQARPTLIFIHMAGGSHVLWQGQIEGLAERPDEVNAAIRAFLDRTGL